MSINRARQLRKTMTPQEAKLWIQLRLLRPRGYHFRRQDPFKSWCLDFVCFKHRLVIEVDGGQHAGAHKRIGTSCTTRCLPARVSASCESGIPT